MTLSQTSDNSVLRSAFNGAAAGSLEVLLNHPLFNLKIRSQCGYPFSIHPTILYRGVIPELVSMLPVDMIQALVYTFVNEKVFKNKDNHSEPKKFAAAFISGGIGGSLINGVESIMTLQQKYNTSFSHISKRLLSDGNLKKQISVGTLETAARNGIYNAGFFVLTPLMGKSFKRLIPNEDISLFSGGIAAGLFAAVLSQPFDTVKTIRHADEGATSIKQALSKIYMSEGISGFFKGLTARGARVVSGVAIMGYAYEKLQNGSSQVLEIKEKLY